MKEIKVNGREYGKALRNAHPLDRFDAEKRVVNAVGRLTAMKLNKDAAFIDALKNNKVTSAGNKWHNTANEVAKKMAARIQKISGLKLHSEKTIKSGAGGSRADMLIESVKQTLSEFDWKTTGKSALKSIGQMKKHAAQIAEKFGAKPVVQESRSWIDFIREKAPEAAKHLGNLTSLFKSKGGAGKGAGNASGKNSAATAATFDPTADKRAMAEWGEQSTTQTASSRNAQAGKSSTRVQQGSSTPSSTNLPTKSGLSLGHRSASASSGKSAPQSSSSTGSSTKLSTRSGQSLGNRGAPQPAPSSGEGPSASAATKSGSGTTKSGATSGSSGNAASPGATKGTPGISDGGSKLLSNPSTDPGSRIG